MKFLSAFVLGISALFVVATGNFVIAADDMNGEAMEILNPDTGVVTRLDAEACRVLAEGGVIMNMMKLMDKVKMLQRGQMLEASLLQQDSTYVYEIEMAAKDGVVHMLWIDAVSGELIKEN